MPKRKSELRFTDPRMQAIVEQRRAAMARNRVVGTPGRAGNPGFEDSHRQDRLEALRQLVFGSTITPQQGSRAVGKINELVQDPEEKAKMIRGLPLEEQPEEIGWGLIEPRIEELLKKGEQPEGRSQLYDPGFLKTLDDDELSALSEQARTNGEAEDTDLEMDARGWNEELVDGTTIPGRTWLKGKYTGGKK